MLWPCGTRGFFKNYALHDDWCEWRDEHASIAPSIETQRRIRENREREQRRRVAAVHAARLYWDGAQPAGLHPYIQRKGLSILGLRGLRERDGKLLIPMRKGSLLSVQTISADGEKKFWAGAPTKGTSFELARDRVSITCLVEGLATGLAVFQAVPQARVIVAFDSGNLVPVAESLQLRGAVVVCADNDHGTLAARGFNPGLLAAQKVADAIGCGMAYLTDNAGSMQADDLLRMQGAVKKSAVSRDSQVIADEIYRSAVAPALAPPDSGRLENLVRQAESGGRRNGPDGKLLQGPITRSGERAQGEMQVMPSTARDPGYGIKPADLSGTPEQQADEIARVGREKLPAMLKRYAGDVPKALAAYNWGEGNVDKAIKAKGADWLTIAPAETEVEHSTKLDAYARMIADKPVTRQFLTQPENARVAHDDVESMSLIETLANSFRRGVPGLQQGLAATALRANAGQLEQFDAVAARIDGGEKPASIRAADDPMGVAYMSPEQRTRMRASISTPLAGNIATVADTQKERQAIPQPGVVGDVLDAKTFGAAFSAFLTAPVQFIASIGPESLISSAPGLLAAIPAGIAAGPGAAAAVMGSGSFATDFGSSIVEALTKSGVDVADPTALAAATQNGPLMREVAAQAFAHASVVGSVDGASGGLASKVVLPQVMAARLATRPVARELTNAAIQVPAQGALGGIGEAGGQIAAGQDIQPGSILAEIVGEAFTAPAEVGGIAGRRVVERMQEARAAGAAAVRVEEALKVAEASKLRARDPAAFREFVDQVADGGELPTEFFIDPQTLANTLNQSGMTVAELQALAPSVAAQMTPENFVPGADLRISVAELLAAPAEVTAPLVDHLRESEGAMTRAEAAQYLSEKGAAIQQEVSVQHRARFCAFPVALFRITLPPPGGVGASMAC